MGHAIDAPPPGPSEIPDDVRTSLCWLLTRASYVLETKLTAALEALGIPPRSHYVLTTAMTGEHTQIELARLIGLDKTTMVVVLDELEAAGLAERRPSKTDRRARVIHVTKAGERLLRKGDELIHEVYDEVLAPLAPRERQAFLDSLGKLVHGSLAEPAECAQPVRRRRAA